MSSNAARLVLLAGLMIDATPIGAGAVVHEGQILARIAADGAPTMTRPK